MLIVARGLQGVFGALLTPASLAIIVTVFPESERGAAIGAWTAWGGIGYLAGPLLGGQLVDQASWRWVFVLNLPLAADHARARAPYVPGGRGGDEPRRRLDLTGALLCALGLAGISFGLIEQPLRGWMDPRRLAAARGGRAHVRRVPALRARARRQPMLPLGLFRRRNFSVANVETFLMYGGHGAPGVLPHAVPAAGRRVQRDRGGRGEPRADGA